MPFRVDPATGVRSYVPEPAPLTPTQTAAMQSQLAGFQGQPVPATPAAPDTPTPVQQGMRQMIAAKHPQLYQMFGAEINADIAQAESTMYLAEPNAAVADPLAHAVIGRHSNELFQQAKVQQGLAVDTTKLPAAYVAELNRLGVTDDLVRRVARGRYPDLSEKDALARWTEVVGKEMSKTNWTYDGREMTRDYDPD